MSDLLLESSARGQRRLIKRKEAKEMGRAQKDAHNSAAARQMTEKPTRLGIARTKELIATLDSKNVEQVSHLGNCIVVYNAGRRLVLC